MGPPKLPDQVGDDATPCSWADHIRQSTRDASGARALRIGTQKRLGGRLCRGKQSGRSHGCHFFNGRRRRAVDKLCRGQDDDGRWIGAEAFEKGHGSTNSDFVVVPTARPPGSVFGVRCEVEDNVVFPGETGKSLPIPNISDYLPKARVVNGDRSQVERRNVVVAGQQGLGERAPMKPAAPVTSAAPPSYLPFPLVANS